MLAGAAAAIVAWPEAIRNLFVATYLPHSFCYLLQPHLMWLHVTSDVLIGIAYVAISFMLGVLVHRNRKDIPFSWVFIAFGLFIVSCGATHFMEAITVWHPYYWLEGDLKLLTAVASLATAFAMPPLIPRTVQMVRQAKSSAERKRRLEGALQELETVYAQLQELDRLKTDFFANVSHELRTPLSLILAPAERMLRTSQLGPDERESLEIIQRNAHVLLRHVNELLDISKFDAGKLEPRYAEVDLAELVRFVCSQFESVATERGIQFRVLADEALPSRVDPEKVQRILLNLISNALRFTPDGGKLRCELRSDGTVAVVEVADSGPGVDREERDTIFERFQQSKRSSQKAAGTGLGLTIARDFARLLRGDIVVEPAPEGGALFRVSLPLASPPNAVIYPAPPMLAPVAKPIEHALKPQPSQSQSTDALERGLPVVLVAEDNPDMMHMIRETLRTHYEVVAAANGQEALRLADIRQPDLIISDVMMPVMSGDELLVQLKQHGLGNIPVILLSARADDSLRVRMLRQGVADYLVKPFSAEEMLARVQNAVSHKRVRDLLQQALASQSQSLEEMVQELADRNQELSLTLTELHDSQSRIRRLTEANVVGVIEAGFDGTMLSANEAVLHMLGYERDEFLNLNWRVITPPEYAPLDDDAVSQLLDTGVYRPYEKEYFRKDGSRVPILLGGTIVEGSPSTIVAFVVDLTERKRAEQALANSEKLATVGRLAGTIAHEINNPLDAVGNLLYLLDTDPTVQDPAKRWVTMANEEIRRVSHITKQMLGFYRESTIPVPLKLSEVLDAVIELYSRNLARHNITVDRDYQPHAEILGYPGEMRQVFSNLLVNAIEASPEGSRIRVRIRPGREQRSGRSGVFIFFSDQGSGIPPELRSHIFEPFFTSKGEKGTGLGLWVTNGIVHKHGGNISVRSRNFGRYTGTSFLIFLPQQPPARSAPHTEAEVRNSA
ncbi:MAG TPA: ATP-binding protein [Terriglobales bacterium]